METTTKKKIIFYPLPAYGHLYPTSNVMRALHIQGHEVICYSLKPFKEFIEATGAEYREYPFEEKYTRSITRDDSLFAGILIDKTKTLLPILLNELEAAKPDGIVHDAVGIWGKILAKKTGISAISLCCTLAYHDRLLLKYPHVFVKSIRKGGKSSVGTFKKFHALYRHYGIKPPPIGDVFLNHEPLTVVFTSRLFHPCGESYNSTFRFVGPSIAPRREANTFVLPKGKKVIYISLGTVVNDNKEYYDTLINVFRGTSYTVVLSLGNGLDVSEFSDIPSNVIVKKYVNQLEVLQNADVFISHAGLNSINESLYYGVPMVLIPDTAEQLILARRVQELGAGIVEDTANTRKNSLLESVEKIFTTKSYYLQAKEIQHSLRQGGGYDEATQAILAYLS